MSVPFWLFLLFWLFRDWLRAICNTDPLGRSPERLYPPEDESVWLIPPIGTFVSSKAFEEYIIAQKPLLLANEIQRIISDVSSFRGKIDAAQFDEFFELHVRASVAEIDVVNGCGSKIADLAEGKQ